MGGSIHPLTDDPEFATNAAAVNSTSGLIPNRRTRCFHSAVAAKSW